MRGSDCGTDHVRYYKLDGVVFRVRLDRLDRGAEYLRHDEWVWTPITSEAVTHDPRARELPAATVESLPRDASEAMNAPESG